MIGEAEGFRWRAPDGFVPPAEIVMRHVQRHGCRVVLQLFAKAVCQPREPTRTHADRQIAPLALRTQLGQTLGIAQVSDTAEQYEANIKRVFGGQPDLFRR